MNIAAFAGGHAPLKEPIVPGEVAGPEQGHMHDQILLTFRSRPQ